LSTHLNLEAVDVLIYIRSTVGTLTIIGAHADYWNRQTSPLALSRPPSLVEMAAVLQEVVRREGGHERS
jgi:hypothetical protein